MRKYFSCGQYNIFFKYIILNIIFDLLYDCIHGYNIYDNLFYNVRIFSGEIQESFSNHYLIYKTFDYLGVFLFSFLFHKCDSYILKKDLKKDLKKPINEKLTNKEKINGPPQILLIHNVNKINIEEQFLKSKDLYRKYIIICILWVVEEQLLKIFQFGLKDLDFWMFELLIITYLSARMFKLEIFNHQKFAILFNLFPCILKIITIGLSFNEEYENLLYINEKSLIAVGIIIYIILIILRSYVNSKIKWFMDFKYISPKRLLMIYGLIGASICFIVSFITTLFKCKGSNENEKYIADSICKVCESYTISNNNITNDTITYKYFENFLIYFSNFKSEALEIFKELFKIILGMISNFLSKYYFLLVIKYLTPVYIIFLCPIFFFLQKIILISNTLIYKHWFFNDDGKDSFFPLKITRFALDISGDIISFFGFLVYLEIIELNFCNLNYNLRKNIMKRGYYETYDCQRCDSSVVNSDEDETEEENEEENEDLIVNNL